MEKTIYELLNEVETDFEEYERTELSSEEKDTYKRRILAEVKNMKMEERSKKRKVWQRAAGLAAACAVVIGGVVLAANPVLAEQLFSSVFGKVISTTDERSGDKAIQGKVATKAWTIQEELDRQENPGDYTASVESNGVTLAVSDVYCDGSVLYYTLSMWTDDENMNKAQNVFLYLQDGMMYTPILEGSNGEEVMAGGTLSSLKKADDGSYVCMNQLDLFGLSEEDRAKLQLEEAGTLNVRYELDGLTGVEDITQMDQQGRYKETARVEGEWNLKFPVTIDASSKEEFEINKEENGIMVKTVTKTETTLIVEVDYSEYATKEPYDYGDDPEIGVKDSEGNYLTALGGAGGNSEMFTALAKVVYDGQKDLVVCVLDYSESEEGVTIAEIPIQLP